MDVRHTVRPPVSSLALVENVSDAITVLDRDGMVQFANQALQPILGYTPEQFTGHRFTDFVIDDDIPSAFNQLQAVLDDPDNTYHSELTFKHKDGSTRLLQSQVVNRLADPDIHSLIVTSRDITEQRQTQLAYQKALEDVDRGLRAIITAIGATIVARDPYTASHQAKVADLCHQIGRVAGLDDHRLDSLCLSATVHDVGKIRIPIEILTKPIHLLNEERELINIHPAAGYNILKDIPLPWPIADIVHQHHERLDGSGYPKGLTREDILPEARIIAVADAVEAMANDRPYRRAPGLGAALETIRKERGVKLEAEFVDICISLFKKQNYQFPSDD